MASLKAMTSYDLLERIHAERDQLETRIVTSPGEELLLDATLCLSITN